MKIHTGRQLLLKQILPTSLDCCEQSEDWLVSHIQHCTSAKFLNSVFSVGLSRSICQYH